MVANNNVKFLQGNVAAAEGAIAAGCRFFAGYPITPATEIAEHMARRMPEVNGYYIQMEDEIGSLASVIGASWAGRKAMTATSGPGFSLMQEHIGMAAMLEVPCVIIDVQRGGPATGQATKASQGDIMATRWGSHGDYEVITLAPNSGQEMFDLTVEAFNLSEKYRVPTFVVADEIIGHARERVVLKSPSELEIVERKKPSPTCKDSYLTFKPEADGIPLMASLGDGYKLLIEPQTHEDSGHRAAHIPEAQQKLISRLCNKIRLNTNQIARVEGLYLDDAQYLVISYGSSSRSALRAVKIAREKGFKVGFLRLITIWPFHEEKIREVIKGSGVKSIYVVEMNLGQVFFEVQRASRDLVEDVKLISKIGGEMHKPEEILLNMEGVITQ